MDDAEVHEVRVSETVRSSARVRIARHAIRLVLVLALGNGVATVLACAGIVRGRLVYIGGPDPGLPLEYLPQFLSFDDGGRGLTALELPVLVRAVSALPDLVLGIALTWAGLLVVQVLRQILRGQSFSAAARTGLGRLSLVLILGGVIHALLAVLAGVVVHSAVVDLGGPMSVGQDVSIPVLVITLGVIAAAVLYALTDGARLEKDVEGVI